MDLKKILVPIDFSKFSDSALEFAESLARESNAMLHIVHVKEPFHIYEADARYGDLAPYADLDNLKNALERIRPEDRSIECHHWLVTGAAIQGIVDLAARESIDLIVIGTHGRTGVMRVLMGSVAEGVLRKAPCPVLTVKHHEPATAEDESVTSKASSS